jgi:hypothetical protein
MTKVTKSLLVFLVTLVTFEDDQKGGQGDQAYWCKLLYFLKVTKGAKFLRRACASP